MRKTITILLLLPLLCLRTSQAQDSSSFAFFKREIADSLHRFRWGYAAAPAAVAGMSALVCTPFMQRINASVRESAIKHPFSSSIAGADDYLQYLPLTAAALTAVLHRRAQYPLGNRLLMIGTAAVIELALVNAMKYSFGIRRPDGSTNNAFPSGHTATAFMGAEMLRLNSAPYSLWYGAAGYAVAGFVGYSRIRNNRHWLGDVLCGAAAGVFAAQAAWMLYPYLHRTLFSKRQTHAFVIMPYSSPQQSGVTLGLWF